jgi:cellulose synthase operon protein C
VKLALSLAVAVATAALSLSPVAQSSESTGEAVQPALVSDPPPSVLVSGRDTRPDPNPLPDRFPVIASARELQDQVAEVEKAPPHTQTTALRRLWASWDKTDPKELERALLLLGSSPRVSVEAQAYARLLRAFARTRRGDFAGAKREISSLRYVDQWLLVGPFDNEGKGGFDAVLAPELELSRPIELGRSYPGRERIVRWRALPQVFPYGWMDLGSLVSPKEKVCAFVSTFVRDERATKPTEISVWVGAAGAFKFFVNGQTLFSDDAYRRHDTDRYAIPVVLEPGYNDFTFKLCGLDSAPMLSVRLADPAGRPDPHLVFTNDPKVSQKARQHDRSTSPARPVGTKLQGPLFALRRSATEANPTASDLTAYAEYLSTTNSDDPTKHEARDAAIRAAEMAPTVGGLLLAAELAEDRNQRARWIEKAEKLAGGETHRNVRVLLARAALDRGGPNPRAALPSYDRVLRLEPDNVEAIVARAELQAAVGLDRTALVALDRAVAGNPTSVRLLGARAERLRALGRTTEALETERRYAALRFDDGAWLNHMVELSLSRHDRDAALWWADRALQMSPAAGWAQLLAAKTYRGVGDVDRAVAAYQRWLEVSPDDVVALRGLADIEAERGQKPRQLSLLRRVLEIQPQDKETRAYLEHLAPASQRDDEKYAWQSERFLALRHAPKDGRNRRTLRDLTVTTVFPNGLSASFRQVVFQPLTDGAAALSRQYAFAYQADRQMVELRGARVYRMDGRTDEAVESGEAPADDPSISMYTSARTFYVQFPRLEPGDVVELRYRIEDVTPRNEFADYFGDLVYLQSEEPVANAEYVLLTPKQRRMYFDTNLGSRVVHETSERGEHRVDRFFAKTLDAIDPEPEMPPFPEVAGFVHASTFDSWESMGRWYWGFVRDQLDTDEETRRLAQRIVANATTDLDKVKAIYRWVVENTRYVGLEFGVYGYKPYRAVQTVTRGWGDCKDKASAITTLLETVGVEASLVILRTQLRGEFHSKIASLAAFDHAIVYVPSLDLYLDGTAEGTGIFELPVMDQGAFGMQIRKGDPVLVTLPDQSRTPNRVERQITVQLNPEGGGRAEMLLHAAGAGASGWRHQFEATATRRERLGADIAQEFPGFVVDSGPEGVVAEGVDDIDRDVKVEVRGSSPQLGRRETAGFSLPVSSQPRLVPTFASLSSRKHDVRLLGLAAREDTFTIHLAPGQKILSTPSSSESEGVFGGYSISVDQRPSTITVRSRLTLSKKRITPSEYPAFRDFCAKVDEALSQRLVVSP